MFSTEVMAVSAGVRGQDDLIAALARTAALSHSPPTCFATVILFTADRC